ncbi:hypothetical protein C7S16_5505 [Burkholderia thailandensis]|uniref:Uncharacterized protein n=1 Tax=Burkholderia thailandensis TaxID=57975 RepID=A0AAW9CMZ3_BURTH|nr:hypothetical protein [Burkholderia thailandensis]
MLMRPSLSSSRRMRMSVRSRFISKNPAKIDIDSQTLSRRNDLKHDF